MIPTYQKKCMYIQIYTLKEAFLTPNGASYHNSSKFIQFPRSVFSSAISLYDMFKIITCMTI